jgi:hypothetical protein
MISKRQRTLPQMLDGVFTGYVWRRRATATRRA